MESGSFSSVFWEPIMIRNAAILGPWAVLICLPITGSGLALADEPTLQRLIDQGAFAKPSNNCAGRFPTAKLQSPVKPRFNWRFCDGRGTIFR